MKKVLIKLIPFLFLFSCTQDENCLAKQGVLDLRGKECRTFSLEGEWEFYWNNFYAPEDFHSTKPPEPRYIKVPGYWNSHKIKNKTVGGSGFASYRLGILHSFIDKDLALRVPKISSACEIMINGVRVFQRGQIARTASLAEDYERPGIVEFKDHTGTLNIIIHVSNFSDIVGGIPKPLVMGPADRIINTNDIELIIQSLMFGVLFFFGWSHLGIYSFRKKEKELLFFGFFCLIIAIRLLVRGENLLLYFLPDLTKEYFRKIEFFTVIFGHLSLMFYLRTVLTQRFSKKVLYTLVGVGSFYGLFVLFGPLVLYARFLMIYQLIILISALYCLLLFLMPRRSDIPLYGIYFSCLLILIVSFVIEGYHVELGFYWGEYLFSYGLLFFIGGQSWIIAGRYSRNFEEVTLLSNRLQEYNINLEKKIKERTRQLEESEKQKTIFFVNVAHETKTPLTLMELYLERHFQKYGESVELKIVGDNLNRLSRIIRDFMYLEKRQPPGSKKQSEVINCQLFLNDKLEQFQALALEKKQCLVGEIQEGLFIKVDPHGLDKIINNLLDNALKYSFEMGNILLRLWGTEKDILIEVKDDGPGISVEDQQNIFKDFFQVSALTAAVPGIGMGLSIVKKLTKEMGGEVVVKSAPGEGARFLVRFSRYFPEKGEKSLADYEYENPDSNESVIELPEIVILPHKETILIVEDYKALVKILIEELSPQYNIAYALDGREALQKLTSIPKPHLIISDIMMNRMDGLEFFKQLQSFKNADDIPFIFLTAKSGEEDRISALGRGAVDYITKPFSIEALKNKIQSILKLQQNQVRNIGKHYKKQIEDFLGGTTKAEAVKPKDIVLNQREEQVALLLLKAMPYKRIAEELDLSLSLVKKIAHSIYGKYDVSNRRELKNKIRDLK